MTATRERPGHSRSLPGNKISIYFRFSLPALLPSLDRAVRAVPLTIPLLYPTYAPRQTQLSGHTFLSCYLVAMIPIPRCQSRRSLPIVTPFGTRTMATGNCLSLSYLLSKLAMSSSIHGHALYLLLWVSPSQSASASLALVPSTSCLRASIDQSGCLFQDQTLPHEAIAVIN